MGKFWDDLNALLGYPPDNDLGGVSWDNLTGETDSLNLRGVRAEIDAPLESLETNRRMPTQEIAAIIQKRDRAFNVFQISPFNLSQNQFASLIPQSILNTTVGYEGDQDVASGNRTTNAWRTVEISVPGDFVKIDFLPNQINFSHALNTNPYNYSKENQAYVQGLNTLLSSDYVDLLSSRAILIQFDEPNSTPYVHKPGDTYNVPFSKIYVTCKTYVPRFEVTLGYNAKIVATGDDRLMQSQLGTGPGYGLWDSPSRHTVPFCFTDTDQDRLGVGIHPSGQVPLVTMGAFGLTNLPVTYTLIDLDNQTPTPYGVGVGWITGLRANIMLLNYDGSGTPFISGFVAILNVYTQQPVSLGSGRKLLTSLRANFSLIKDQTNNTDRPVYNIEKSFNTPIRFSLLKNGLIGGVNYGEVTKLVMTVSLAAINSNGQGRQAWFRWCMEGYTFGALNATNLIAAQTDTYWGYGMDLSTTHPFPLDARWGAGVPI